MGSFLRIRALLIVGIVVFLVLPSWVAANDPVQTERVGGLPYTDELERQTTAITAFVRDAQGNPVSGLTQTDFELFESGEELRITGFEAVSVDEARVGEAVPDVPGDEAEVSDHAVYLVFFIDNQFLRYADRSRVLRALQESVRQGLGDQVQMMVVSHTTEFEVLQPFTTDRRAVIEALRAVRLAEPRLDERDAEHQKIQQQIRRTEKNSHHSYQSRQQESSDLYANIHNFAKHENEVLSDSLSALRQVFTALTGITGRRYVIHISNGLPFALGADLLHQFGGLQGMNTSATKTYARTKKRQFDAVAAAANAQGITIHTIDATGTKRTTSKIGDTDSKRAASASVVARETFQKSIRFLAAKTGGLAFVETDDFTGAMTRIGKSFSVFYSLHFELPSGGEDTIHQVDVRLVDKTEYNLNYSRTFINKSPETKIQDRVTAGLFFDVDRNPLSIELAEGTLFQATEDRWQLPLQISLPVASLAMTKEGDEYVGTAMHFIALMNVDGKTTDLQQQTHTFHVPVAEYEAQKSESFPIFVRLLLSSGKHRIVIGVYDKTTRQTSIQRLEVTAPQ